MGHESHTEPPFASERNSATTSSTVNVSGNNDDVGVVAFAVLSRPTVPGPGARGNAGVVYVDRWERRCDFSHEIQLHVLLLAALDSVCGVVRDGVDLEMLDKLTSSSFTSLGSNHVIKRFFSLYFLNQFNLT